MKLNKYDIILGILILFNIGLSIYSGLTINYNDNVCTDKGSCDTVKTSIYSSILGIKVVWIGVACFSILFLLFLIARFNKKLYWMFFTASIIGAIGAFYFLFLQIFVLKKICLMCFITDIIAVIMLVIIVFEYLDFKKEIKKIEKEVVSEIKRI